MRQNLRGSFQNISVGIVLENSMLNDSDTPGILLCIFQEVFDYG